MDRSRVQILGAAAALVAESGLRGVTMAALARRARVAKATVYNHFRDRDEVLRGLLVAERDSLIAHCAAHRPEERCAEAARWLARHPVLHGLRTYDPDVVVRLATAALEDPRVRDQVGSWTSPGEDPDVTTRWLVTFGVTGVETGDGSVRPPSDAASASRFPER